MSKRFAKVGWFVFWTYITVQFLGAATGAFVAIHFGDETVQMFQQLTDKL